MPKTTVKEFHKYLKDWLDTNFQDGIINRNQRDGALRTLGGFLQDAVDRLNSGDVAVLPLLDLEIMIHLREGRELTGKFNFFEFEWPRVGRPPRRLTCFLGHRFKSSINKSLRFNLRNCLEPSNIELIWSGRDFNATGFFDEIVDLISQSHFCIFDNRETDRKPNVYIELGVAYCLRKPFLFANYKHNRVGIPSDLTHITSIPYEDYAELSKLIYFHLPGFLRRHQFRS